MRTNLFITLFFIFAITFSACNKNKDDGIAGTTIGGSQKIYGCTDPKASNYNSAANTDDGTCKYPPACEINKTGTITLTNNSTNPYNIYVNGILIVQLAGTTETVNDINEGNGITIKAEQASGYVFTPTIKTTNFNVVRCTAYAWKFPN